MCCTRIAVDTNENNPQQESFRTYTDPVDSPIGEMPYTEQ
jgi:hypothetical protein